MQRRLRQFLWACWYRLWALVAAAVIVLALTFSAARLLLPLLPGYHHQIEQRASAVLERPVSIGRMTTDWKWFRPRLKLLDVRLENAAGGDSPLGAEQLVLGVNLLASMVHRRLEVDEITVVGTRLAIRRDEGGRFYLHGIDGPLGLGLSNLHIPPVLHKRTITLAGAVIDYTDEILALDHRFHNVNATIRLDAGSIRGYLDAGLPRALGQRLEAGVELAGPLDRPEQLSGRLFVRAEALALDEWARRLGAGRRIRSGGLSFGVWADIAPDNRYRLTGRFQGRNLAVDLPGREEEPWRAASVRSDFRIELTEAVAGVDLHDLVVERGGRSWPAAGLSFRTDARGDARLRRGALAAGFVRLEDALPWIDAAADIDSLLERYGVEAVRGDLNDVYAMWDLTGETPSLALETGFSRLGLAGGRIPSFSGLGGELLWRDKTADLRLSTDTFVFDYPRLFRAPLPTAVVDGRVQIRPDGNAGWRIGGRDVWVDTVHAQTRHWFDLHLPAGEAARIDARAQASVSDAAAAPRYLPAGVIKSKTLEWLDNALVSGVARNAEVRLSGPLNRFPYRDGGGVFRVDFETEGNEVDFWPPGPPAQNVRARVRFSGPGLSIFAHELTILDSNVQDVELRIDDLGRTPLHVRADAYGPLADVAEYLRRSRLRRAFGGVLDQVSAAGSQALRLDLTVPLGGAPGEVQYRVDGDVHGGELVFSDWDLRFAGLSTPVEVTEKSVSSPPFAGTFNGQSVELELATVAEPRRSLLEARMNADLRAGALLERWNAPLAAYIDGTSAWRARFRAGLYDERGRAYPPRLLVDSDLRGTALGLPAPLNKPAGREAALKAEAVFRDGGIDGDLRYGGWLRGALRIDGQTGGGLRLTRADLRLNAGAPRLRGAPGIYLTGSLGELDLDRWRALSFGGRGGEGLVGKVRSVDLKAGRLSLLHRSVEDVDLRLKRQEHNWKLRLDADDIHGQILIPRHGFQTRGLAIDLESADFDRIDAGRGGDPPDPAEVPPFQLTAGSLKLNGWDLRDVRVLAEPGRRSLVFHSIRILDPVVGLEGRGRWFVDGRGHHRTELQLNFQSTNAGLGLSRFGFNDAIRGGRGRAQFDIRWNDAPSAFSPSLLGGEASIALDDGQILQLNPGGGRVLGLLSLQMIPRRLALDFGDLFRKGFRFDKMRGDFEFVDGNAHTDNYYIDGPIGRLDITGRIGLAARDYDQRVVFRPDLSSSLPLVGALIGGSTGGWAVVLADRIARLFGKQADDLGRVEYTVTGSWENPEIEPVKSSEKREPKRQGESASG